MNNGFKCMICNGQSKAFWFLDWVNPTTYKKIRFLICNECYDMFKVVKEAG